MKQCLSGDSDADIQAGLEANVHTIGVKWFYRTNFNILEAA